MTDDIKNFFRRMHWGYYNYLLMFLIFLFAARPYSSNFVYFGFWKFLFTCTFLAAVFGCKHNPRVKVVAMLLAIPTIIFTWLDLIFPIEPFLIMNMLCTITLLIICSFSILSDVLRYAKVTLETLRGVICVYFMIAFCFAYIYYLVEYLQPGSFHLLGTENILLPFNPGDLSDLMYFSFITLLTIGFGDVSPRLNLSQTFVVLEGIIGQFYIAMLVSRIVAVYSYLNDQSLIKEVHRTMHPELQKKSLPHKSQD